MSCTTHTPARVAPIKQSISRCHQLGICQAETPRCEDCDESPADQADCFSERLLYWTAIGIAASCTVAVAFGSLSYALHRFGWLTL